MKHVLINYDYTRYPMTTASYLEMAARRRPDITVYRNGEPLPEKLDLVLNIEPCPEFVRIPGVPCHYYEIDNHIKEGNERWFYETADVLWLAQWNYKDYYSKYPIRELPLGFDVDLHRPNYLAREEYDIGFIGNNTYPHRRRLMEIMSEKYNVFHTSGLWGAEYSDALAKCKMIFNCSLLNDINMRVFEALGIEKMLVTNRLPHQDDFIKEDEHYVAYSNEKELMEKLAYYIDKGCYRRTIARQGRSYALEHHTYDHRLATIIPVSPQGDIA